VSAYVFLGPTLSIEQAHEYLDAEFLPPVQQGDVLRVLGKRPTAIGIVDGYFELVPSVWHKEILVALSRGVPVFGAASMGALRAAELHTFAMVGVGQIFEWFCAGVLEDDDEVAVLHGAAETGYAPLSWRSILARASSDANVSELRAFERFLAVAGPPLKQRDAIEMLQRMAEDSQTSPLPRIEALWVLERTVFLDALMHEVEQAAAGVSSPSEPSGGGDWLAGRSKPWLVLTREAALAHLPRPSASVGCRAWHASAAGR
jgi:hypothetical protein